MRNQRLTLLCLSFAWQWQSVARAAPPQVVLEATRSPERQLHGRFLHITDMHPDPYYRHGTSESTACHRKKPKDTTRSGYYGTPYSECDSPLTLTNFTLDYLEEDWSSEIDFVVWTGDSARHDNDREIPRTLDEIYESNRAVAKKMYDAFLSKGIPVVPSIGNNDISPHNLMYPGPNDITNAYSSIWSQFIPSSSSRAFQQGAYYAVEVIPDAIAVISLNTIYFYDSNKAVGGCEYKDQNDAGNLEFDWLETELKKFRSRGMQVWITGHVPPSPGNYFPECFYRYVELGLRFQDTILGHLYGHMNADHFFFLDANDLQIWPNESPSTDVDKNHLYDTLISEFEHLAKEEVNYDDFVVVNVAPSVVPNPYVPSFRVYSYNITGLTLVGDIVRDEHFIELKKKRKHGHHHGNPGNKETACRNEPYRDTWRCQLTHPWHSDSEAPSRQNTLWSPLGYAQYNIPHLLGFNSTDVKPRYELQYFTYAVSSLRRDGAGSEAAVTQAPPVPLRNIPKMFQGVINAPYNMADLTIPSWIGLAQRLGKSSEGKLRRRFRDYMYGR